VPPGRRLTEYMDRPAKKARAAKPRKATVRRPPAKKQAAPAAQAGAAIPRKKRDAIIEEAFEYFSEVLDGNLIDAAASNAADYVGAKIWSELTRDWSGRNCRWLARLARRALNGMDWLHGWVARIVVFLLELFGLPRIVCLFGRTLAKRIPLPGGHELKMVARGMQIAGIVICILDGRDLRKCSCFVDVVLEEGKERLQRLMEKAAGDWRDLDILMTDP
jgi:hypothetical protein